LIIGLAGALVPMLLDRDIEEAQRVVPAEPLHHGEPDGVFIAAAVRAAAWYSARRGSVELPLSSRSIISSA
jgi:hypothetical protein